jgi:DNA-binding LacI/PurR family transcriptional regulator
VGTGKRRRRSNRLGPSLADVARAAGVSLASASRALARPEMVSDELRDKVVEQARVLGYVAEGVRGFGPSGQRCFGALLEDLEDPTLRTALQACAAGLQADGDALLIALVGPGPDTAHERVRDLRARGAVAIARFGVPTSRLKDPEPPGTLSFDGEGTMATDSGYCRAEAIALAALYLHSLGHARIGLMGSAAVPEVRAMCARQAANSPELIDAGEGTGLLALVAQTPPVTAVVCESDFRAVQVLELCLLHGIDVPGALAVVGYGDTALARKACPPLTTLRVPAAAAGAALAKQLAAPASARERSPILSAKLVVRDSSPRRVQA